MFGVWRSVSCPQSLSDWYSTSSGNADDTYGDADQHLEPATASEESTAEAEEWEGCSLGFGSGSNEDDYAEGRQN